MCINKRPVQLLPGPIYPIESVFCFVLLFSSPDMLSFYLPILRSKGTGLSKIINYTFLAFVGFG